MTKNAKKHHVMFIKRLDGVAHVITKISHSSKEIDDYLAGLMAKECGLYLREFWDLVDCPLTQGRWDALIRERFVDGKNPFLP